MNGFLSFTVVENEIVEAHRSGIIDHARWDAAGVFVFYLSAQYDHFQVHVANYGQPVNWHLEELTSGKFVVVLKTLSGDPYNPDLRCIVTVEAE